MSGGNPFAISDFNVASKWFYNWIPDSSIVHMQPEGPTSECPSCVNSGSFRIKPFDMRTTPSANDIMGVHIPITTKYDSVYKSDYVFSYWLSYRSGVDGVAPGILVHLSIFEIYNSTFGAYYDSLLYYAKGKSEERGDAAIRKGNCYHIAPASYIKDQNLLAAEAVQPVVCVDDINVGSSVDISVSFRGAAYDSRAQINSNIQHRTLQCGSGLKTMNLDSSNKYVISVTGTGSNGQVTLKLCNPSDRTEAYFFDE